MITQRFLRASVVKSASTEHRGNTYNNILYLHRPYESKTNPRSVRICFYGRPIRTSHIVNSDIFWMILFYLILLQLGAWKKLQKAICLLNNIVTLRDAIYSCTRRALVRVHTNQDIPRLHAIPKYQTSTLWSIVFQTKYSSVHVTFLTSQWLHICFICMFELKMQWILRLENMWNKLVSSKLIGVIKIKSMLPYRAQYTYQVAIENLNYFMV